MVLVGVKILPRLEVLDVQGRAIAETLNRRGHVVEACHYGKFIQLQFNVKSEEEALESARRMVEDILCNFQVETYELEILDSFK